MARWVRRALLQPTSPAESAQARQCQSRLLAQPCLVLGQDKGQWNRLPSTSQSSLPEAGAKDGGREGEDREEAGQSHTESVLSSHYFHSHPGRTTLGGDTFFPAKMYKLINRHHGAHTPQHNRHTPQIHSYWRTQSVARQGNTLTEVFSQWSPTHHFICSLPLGVGEERTPPRTSHPGPTRLEGGADRRVVPSLCPVPSWPDG